MTSVTGCSVSSEKEIGKAEFAEEPLFNQEAWEAWQPQPYEGHGHPGTNNAGLYTGTRPETGERVFIKALTERQYSSEHRSALEYERFAQALERATSADIQEMEALYIQTLVDISRDGGALDFRLWWTEQRATTFSRQLLELVRKYWRQSPMPRKVGESVDPNNHRTIHYLAMPEGRDILVHVSPNPNRFDELTNWFDVARAAQIAVQYLWAQRSIGLAFDLHDNTVQFRSADGFFSQMDHSSGFVVPRGGMAETILTWIVRPRLTRLSRSIKEAGIEDFDDVNYTIYGDRLLVYPADGGQLLEFTPQGWSVERPTSNHGTESDGVVLREASRWLQSIEAIAGFSSIIEITQRLDSWIRPLTPVELVDGSDSEIELRFASAELQHPFRRYSAVNGQHLIPGNEKPGAPLAPIIAPVHLVFDVGDPRQLAIRIYAEWTTSPGEGLGMTEYCAVGVELVWRQNQDGLWTLEGTHDASQLRELTPDLYPECADRLEQAVRWFTIGVSITVFAAVIWEVGIPKLLEFVGRWLWPSPEKVPALERVLPVIAGH